MNYFVVLAVLLALGFTNGLEEEASQTLPERRNVLKRGVRSALDNFGTRLLPLLESQIIANCKSGNRYHTGDDLQGIYDDMKTCMRKKQIFRTPKEEFLAHLEECSKDAVTKTKNCLPEEKKYFPEFILNLAKSVVTFMYDDFDILRVDLAACVPTINTNEAKTGYVRCLTQAATQTHDTEEIPTSKASFCQKFIPVSYCFTDMLRDNCKQTTNMNKFREDYINAMKRPCDQKENELSTNDV